MRTHQSEFAALLHNTMVFTTPPSGVFVHLCMRERANDCEAEDLRVELEKMRKGGRAMYLARELLAMDGGRIDALSIGNYKPRSVLRVMHRLEDIGVIETWPDPQHKASRPPLHYTVTNRDALESIAQGFGKA